VHAQSMEKEQPVALPEEQTVAAQGTLPSLPETAPKNEFKRDFRFWMIFWSIGASQFITALELSAVSTALPTIVEALHGAEFIWVGSAYTIATAAVVPFSGNFASIFGRRITMLGALLLFALGSALCGASKSMNMLIGSRVVQGVGSGGIQSMCQIIISDIVPLKERGLFNGFLALGWVVSNGIGPVIGGALAEYGDWRWLFYLNIPICGTVAALIVVFLRVRTPPGTLAEKFRQIDWMGNLIVMASTTSAMLGLTWGGAQYSWGSYHILVPLILGLAGLVVFMVYEAFVPADPMVPFTLLSKRTTSSGYLQALMTFTIIATLSYYLPVYYQACKDASPVASGVDVFGLAFVLSPTALIAGFSIAVTHKYRLQMWVAWVITIVSMGLFTTVYADTSRGHAIGFEVIAGVGTGILAAALSFPILAPLPIEFHSHALALYTFFRTFSYIIGITIGGTILQNELNKQLPPAFAEQFHGSSAIAYSIIPLIPSLPEPLKTEVRVAFGNSVRVIWQVLIGIAGLGLLFSLGMEQLALHSKTDDKWGLEDRDDAGQGALELEGQKLQGPCETVIGGSDSGSQSRSDSH